MDRRALNSRDYAALIAPLLVCLIITASTGRILAVGSPLGYAMIFLIVLVPALFMWLRRIRAEADEGWSAAPILGEPASE
jgi:hypothetical protein